MVRITQDLLIKKAEHNNGMLVSLKDLALHQTGIEKIELINQACRHLTRLYLHNNVIDKIENLHRMKELQYLNLAINNIQMIENLEKCESLRKLDLTLNFIPASNLFRSINSIVPCYNLLELHLTGNPCTKWHGYRDFVIATLQQLKNLDGKEITPEERHHAMEILPCLVEELHIDTTYAMDFYDQPDATSDYTLRHWCPETRRLDQQEWEELTMQSRHTNNASPTSATPSSTSSDRFVRTSFPDIAYDAHGDALQCNQGNWTFLLEEEEEKAGAQRKASTTTLVLTIHLERHVDIYTVNLDIHPTFIRMISSGKLLQIRFPYEIQSSRAVAQRSKATGKLRIVMPLAKDDIMMHIGSGGGARREMKASARKQLPLTTAIERAHVTVQGNDCTDVPDIQT